MFLKINVCIESQPLRTATMVTLPPYKRVLSCSSLLEAQAFCVELSRLGLAPKKIESLRLAGARLGKKKRI